MIYEPAEDTFLLAKHIKNYIKDRNAKVLDLGTGSAYLAVEAKKYSNNVIASDINPKAEIHSKKHKIKFIHSNLFSNIKGKFDLILFNPPYLPEEKQEAGESSLITTGGNQGYELIEEFLKQAKSHLNKSGRILLICSTLTGNVEFLFKKYNFKFKLIDEEKAFFERILLYELQQKSL